MDCYKEFPFRLESNTTNLGRYSIYIGGFYGYFFNYLIFYYYCNLLSLHYLPFKLGDIMYELIIILISVIFPLTLLFTLALVLLDMTEF